MFSSTIGKSLLKTSSPLTHTLSTRNYSEFISAVKNIGGLTQKQLYQYQLYCLALIGSQRHKLENGILSREDEYFKPSQILPLPDTFPHLNVTAIRTPDLIYDRHFADALSLIPIIEAKINERIKTSHNPHNLTAKDAVINLLDIGSGGGVPGLAISIARPNWNIVCMDVVAKKANFLKHTIDFAGLHNAHAISFNANSIVSNSFTHSVDLSSSAHDHFNDFTFPPINSQITDKLTILNANGCKFINNPDNIELSPYVNVKNLIHPPPHIHKKEIHLKNAFSFVVARGVTQLTPLLKMCAPYVKRSGYILSPKSAHIPTPETLEEMKTKSLTDEVSLARYKNASHPDYVSNAHDFYRLPFNPTGQRYSGSRLLSNELGDIDGLANMLGLSNHQLVSCREFFEADPDVLPLDVKYVAFFKNLNPNKNL